MQELITEVKELRKQLNDSVNELKKVGYNKAKSEYNYRIALAKEILIQRSQGTPVTIINDIVKGNENIASLKLKRDSYETLYEATKEKIQATKLELRIIDNQLQAERRGE